MTNVKGCTLLSLIAILVLLWSIPARGELARLQGEGRIDKVDVAGFADPVPKVGSTFLFVFSYDTQVKGTLLVESLMIDSVELLTGNEAFVCRAKYSSKVGDWYRLRFAAEPTEVPIASSPDTSTASIDVKLALDSRINDDSDTPTSYPYHLPLKDMMLPLGKGEMFFHFIYRQRGGAEGLVSGEIISVTRVDD
ncbi:MAG: hypothetical protein QNI91_10365 [Arenicellales bacterium]|nr:hypothetical protein [Arenicellales bacterium]